MRLTVGQSVGCTFGQTGSKGVPALLLLAHNLLEWPRTVASAAVEAGRQRKTAQ